MSDDIVARLRTEYDRFARVPKENKFWLGPLVHARLAVLFLESANHICHLRKERDEARREVSMRVRRNPERQREFALGRGWDCFEFKEENDNA
jgi:hypothetical protein